MEENLAHFYIIYYRPAPWTYTGRSQIYHRSDPDDNETPLSIATRPRRCGTYSYNSYQNPT